MSDFEKRLPADGRGPIGMIFFEAQTGIYKRHDWPSNFYHYRLRNSYGDRYTSDWIDDAAKLAKLDATAIVWPEGFLEAVAAYEDKCDAEIERHCQRWPDLRENIPEKLCKAQGTTT